MQKTQPNPILNEWRDATNLGSEFSCLLLPVRYRLILTAQPDGLAGAGHFIPTEIARTVLGGMTCPGYGVAP